MTAGIVARGLKLNLGVASTREKPSSIDQVDFAKDLRGWPG